MNAVVPVIPAVVPHSSVGAGVRIVPIVGAYMEPTARSGDMALVVDADRYHAEGLYEMSFFPGTSEIRRCQHLGGGLIRAKSDGRHCTGADFPVEEFNRVVIGRVAAIAHVLDRHLLLAAQTRGAA